jgi:hypothetical protein
VLVGARKTLEAAIDRSLSESARLYSALLPRAARFAQADLWVVASQLPDPLAGVFVPLDTPARAFEGGVTVQNGLQIDALLDAGSPDAAAAAAENLRQSAPAWPSIARAMQIAVSERSVSLTLAATADQLAASLRQTSLPAASVPSPEPEKPAGPQVIRIYGLDEGPREITLPPVNKPEKP